MADANSSPGDGAPLSPIPTNRDALLDEVAEHVREAHEIAASLLEGRHPRPVARSLTRLALTLRHARGLLEGERRAHPKPPARFPVPRPLNPRSFAVAVVASAHLPFEVRLVAADALLAHPTERSTGERLAEISEHAQARVETLGESLLDAVAAAAALDVRDWDKLPKRYLAEAVSLHLRALGVLGVKP